MKAHNSLLQLARAVLASLLLALGLFKAAAKIDPAHDNAAPVIGDKPSLDCGCLTYSDDATR